MPFDQRFRIVFVDAAIAQCAWEVFGIRYGVFTPTEAGAILVVIALPYGLLIYRQLRLRGIGTAIRGITRRPPR